MFLASAKTRDLMLLRLLHFFNRKQAGGADLLKTVTVTLCVRRVTVEIEQNDKADFNLVEYPPSLMSIQLSLPSESPPVRATEHSAAQPITRAEVSSESC